jgi:hypothetical protein
MESGVKNRFIEKRETMFVVKVTFVVSEPTGPSTGRSVHD